MHAVHLLQDFVFEIPGFLSDQECDEMIARAEDIGFSEATITTAQGAIRLGDVRNNDRVIVDDPEQASSLWDRLKPVMPKVFKDRAAVGLNERLRFYRYDVGQQFDWHQDGFYERENGELSQFTFMVYLNDGYEGGGTSFADVYFGQKFADFVTEPKKGSALLFYHPISHRGDPIVGGRKYVLRSDVMYGPKIAG